MITYNKDATLKDLGGGVKRKILSEDKEMMAVEVHFEKGAVGAVHTHPHAQISYCLEGSFEVNIDGQISVFGKGDTYYIKPNIPHGVVALEKGILLDVFTPRRDDFLE